MNQENNAVGNVKRWALDHRNALLGAGVVSIVGHYSGEGDSGALDYIDFLDLEQNLVPPFQPDTVEQLFDALHNELAPEGYENNDGGGGEFCVDVNTGSISHRSYVIYVEHFHNPEETY